MNRKPNIPAGLSTEQRIEWIHTFQNAIGRSCDDMPASEIPSDAIERAEQEANGAI